MKAQHTPGPWNCFKRIPSGTIQTIQSSAGSIAKTCVELDAETQESNARLIAAAPELLEVCELLHKMSGEDGVPLNLSALAEFQNDVFRITARAIAKAKGTA